MQADLEAIRRRFEVADDCELYRVAHAKEHEFIPEVIALAREILGARGLDAESHEAADIAESQRNIETSNLREERDRRSEQMTMTFCAIAGIMVTLIAVCVLAMNGKRHLIGFAWKGCGIGLAVKLGAGLFVLGLMAIGDAMSGAPTPI